MSTDDDRRQVAFWARLGMVICGGGAAVMTVLLILLMIKLT